MIDMGKQQQQQQQPLYYPTWQYGHGLKAFRGPTMQKGYGLGGLFKGLARSFAPVLKKGLINVGKKALKTGVDVLSDVAEGKNLKQSVKQRTKQTFLNAINSSNSNQRVSRKRAAVKKGSLKNKAKKSRKIDIFD